MTYHNKSCGFVNTVSKVFKTAFVSWDYNDIKKVLRQKNIISHRPSETNNDNCIYTKPGFQNSYPLALIFWDS